MGSQDEAVVKALASMELSRRKLRGQGRHWEREDGGESYSSAMTTRGSSAESAGRQEDVDGRTREGRGRGKRSRRMQWQ